MKFRDFLRLLLFPVAVMLDGDFYATEGSLWCKFLTWLYGEGEAGSDGWIYPEGE